MLTSANLLCGCVGITIVFQNNLIWAGYMIFIAALLDFGDGFAARLLKAYSPIGKELDSLADCVTFGVLPAMILFKLLRRSLMHEQYSIEVYTLLPYMAFLISIFSALRLAKFNIDTRQAESFIGVPTPANAMLVASLPLIIHNYAALRPYILNLYVLAAYVLLMSYLMVAELPLFALKFKNFSFADNQIRYVFLIIAVVLLAILHVAALPFIIFLYILLSVIQSVVIAKK